MNGLRRTRVPFGGNAVTLRGLAAVEELRLEQLACEAVSLLTPLGLEEEYAAAVAHNAALICVGVEGDITCTTPAVALSLYNLEELAALAELYQLWSDGQLEADWREEETC